MKAAEVVENLLAHHGVKGMRWGIRNAEKRADKQDTKFTKEAGSRSTWVAIHNASSAHFNAHIGELNKKYEGIDFNKPENASKQKKYNQEAMKLLSDGYTVGAHSITSKSGRLQYHVEEDGANGYIVSTRKVAHADMSGNMPDVRFAINRDEEGKIIEITFDTIMQSGFSIDKFLVHHGQKIIIRD